MLISWFFLSFLWLQKMMMQFLMGFHGTSLDLTIGISWDLGFTGIVHGGVIFLQSLSHELATWLVVWLPFFIFPEILRMSSSQLTFIFFRGVAQPPTSKSRVGVTSWGPRTGHPPQNFWRSLKNLHAVCFYPHGWLIFLSGAWLVFIRFTFCWVQFLLVLC